MTIRATFLAVTTVLIAVIAGWVIFDSAVPDNTALVEVVEAEQSKPPAVQPSGEQTPPPDPKPVEEAPPRKPSALTDDGTWLVPSEMAPGTYRSGNARDCYWSRLSTLDSDNLDGILANGIGPNQTVVVKKTDKAFEHRACGGWKRLR